MEIKVILTGATGLVGEGVLLECLQNPAVSQVLLVSRKHYPLEHPKLKEALVQDFFHLDTVRDQLKGYDACFYCAGVSSNGMTEADYTYITYDTMLHFAGRLASMNPQMVFCHISGSGTDATGKSKMMWARVKGKAENAVLKLPFKQTYNLRPGAMKPSEGQRNVKSYYKIINALFPLLRALFPGSTSTVRAVALAMINCVLQGYPTHTLEVKDIKALAGIK